MALQLITAPAVQPITLAEAKAHLRVDHSEEDAHIELLIAAATSQLDGQYGWLSRALVTQTWELVIDEFPVDEVLIPLPPLQEIVSVEYDDGDGFVQALVEDVDFTVDAVSEPGWIAFANGSSDWPTTFDGINAVRVRFTAGYSPTTDSPPDLTANIPAAIKGAMLLTIGHLYANRETVTIGHIAQAMPWGVENLLRPYRIALGMA